ncbi:MAG: response regulator transcription factor [Nitrosomonadales bacterium]
MQVRLIVTDDHELVRAGLLQLFEGAPGIEVVGEAANGEELMLMLQTTPVDLVLLDLDMPGENGALLIERIKRNYPDLLILILTAHDEVKVVSRAIQAGASGYICKDCSPKTLLDAIHKIVETGKYLTPLMAEELAYASSMPESNPSLAGLSGREQEIFRLLVEGLSNDDISRQLFISDRTVSAHKINLLKKLRLNNVVELVRYSIQHQLFI